MHIDELKQFLQRTKTPPSLLLLSEIRINLDPHISIDIPGYTFVLFFSHTVVGGVGTYSSSLVKFTEIQNLKLQMRGCEDQWFEVQLLGQSDKCIIAVIYRYPWDHADAFLNSVEEKLQILSS